MQLDSSTFNYAGGIGLARSKYDRLGMGEVRSLSRSILRGEGGKGKGREGRV